MVIPAINSVFYRGSAFLQLKKPFHHDSLVERPTRVCTEEEDGQLSLIPTADNDLIRRLRELDVNVLTPIEALQKLYEFNREAQGY